MHKDKDNERVRTRELLLDRYVLALDDGDPEETAAVLDAVYEAALDDPEIDRLIMEITRAYREERRLAPMDMDAELVRALLRQHVPSAFITHEHLKKPLTVGEVAGWLQAQGRVRPGDEETNRSLLGSAAPLPKLLNAQEVKKLAAGLGVSASEFYWRVFRDAAITMGIARSNSQVQLAARERRMRRNSRRDEKKQDS
ncbi:MAG: hypothetical protein LC802_05230 [Acidobacteria bacterium]|nr:hypothetical protein [Acidobacteriota bacterium]